MTQRPEVWTLQRLQEASLGRTAIWSTPSVSETVRQSLDVDEVSPEEADTLIVVGGGNLIDRAKVWARARQRPVRVIAIPSIWGSGAEASPIAVVSDGGQKTIRIDDELIPDVRVRWPELGRTVPPERARVACGDTWAHALEGFLSPLASPDLRTHLAGLIAQMLELPIGYDARWFDVSPAACAAQARSSVGLVHGISHTLEREGEVRWSHAGLCATWLLPVMSFNRVHSDRLEALVAEYNVPVADVFEKLKTLFDESSFEEQRADLAAQWTRVLRDPSSRTNVVLVRPGHLQFFREFDVTTAGSAAIR